MKAFFLVIEYAKEWEKHMQIALELQSSPSL
jgi:hypothetical protein